MAPPRSIAAPPSSPARTVLLTGASSGIGRAATIELARRGDARLLLVARRAAALEETCVLARASAGANVELHAIPCDLTDDAAIDALVAAIIEEQDQLDVLVNNAGTGTAIPFESADAMADADRQIALNLRAPIALVHGLAPLLLAARGTVVNVSSVAGLVGTPGSIVYSSTKWGLTGFSESLRARWHDRGVRVINVQPGPVPTPGWPHHALLARPLIGRLLASDQRTIARAIADAAHGRGGVAPVRPRAYAPVPLLRAVAPWLVRWLLVQAARRGVGTPEWHEASTGETTVP